MHIAIDARIINSSTGRYVQKLLQYIQEIDNKNRFTVIVIEKDKNFWKPTNDNFTVQTVSYDNYSFGEQIGFLLFLNKLKPDLVHFCMPQQPVLYIGKKVTTIHDLTLLKTYNSDKNWLQYHFKQAVGRLVFSHVIKSSDRILVPSEYTKKEVLNLNNRVANKTIVTYEAADVDTNSLEVYPNTFDKYILYVGQQSDYKNIRKLGDAHQQLLQQYPNLGLYLVGKKNKSALLNEEYFKSKNYKNIVFTDFIPDEQKDWLYKNASAYVFPSLMEGFGLPGLEAMGYGCPVISSNTASLPEIYGEAAYYFDPTETTDIARAIDDVISNERLRNDLVTKGYDQFSKYSWRNMALQTYAEYMEALDKKLNLMPEQ